ncbi:MAG: hypothetical protein LBQ67_05420, partial [Treponema sp.]|nr:hypothetical protein [Treponema sp.]
MLSVSSPAQAGFFVVKFLFFAGDREESGNLVLCLVVLYSRQKRFFSISYVPRAESREPRAESREPRAESREAVFCAYAYREHENSIEITENFVNGAENEFGRG